MKNLLILFFIVFTILSCKKTDKVESGFVINGKINGSYKGYVFLYITGSDKIDSALVINQHFHFKGRVSQPTEVSILTKGFSASNRNFFIENTDVFVDLTWTIREIREHKLNWIIVNTIKGTQTSKLEEDFEEFKNNNIKSSDWKTKIYQKLDQVITENPNHPFSGNLLSIFSNDTILNKEELKILYSKLNLDYQATQDIKRLRYNLFAESRVKVGDIFADFSLPNEKGNLISSKKIKADSYVFFDFWASWCKPCRKQLPELLKIAKEDKYHNFKIIGISLDTKVSPWLETIKQEKLLWKNVIDTTAFDGEIASKFAIREIPYNIFVDNNGIIIDVDVSMRDLKKKLDSIYKLD